MRRLLGILGLILACSLVNPDPSQAWPWGNACSSTRDSLKTQDAIRTALHKQAKLTAAALLKDFTNGNFPSFKNAVTTAVQADINIYSLISNHPKCFSADKVASSLTAANSSKTGLKNLQTYADIEGFPKSVVKTLVDQKIDSIYKWAYQK